MDVTRLRKRITLRLLQAVPRPLDDIHPKPSYMILEHPRAAPTIFVAAPKTFDPPT